MRKRDIIKNLHEKNAIKDSLDLLNAHNKTNFQIIKKPNPPDAIIQDESKYSWIEHTDVTRNNDEARELWTYIIPEEPFQRRTENIIINPQKKISLSIINRMVKKLTKDSYKPAFQKYDKGILIMTVLDPLFEESVLTVIEKDISNVDWKICKNKKYFKTVYLCFKGNFWTRHGLVTIYPAFGKYIIPSDVIPKM